MNYLSRFNIKIYISKFEKTTQTSQLEYANPPMPLMMRRTL